MEQGCLELEGTPVAWRACGDRDAPAAVLIHGGAANQRWWDAVLPGLDPGRRIVTFDLSGHGESGHRDGYCATVWANEIGAVIRATTRGRAAVVAHSMGGRVALAAVPTLGEQLERLVLLDVPIDLPPDPELHRRLRKARSIYASREEAVNAFRVVPGTAGRPEIARRVAGASITRSGEGGWLYRGDPAVVGRIPNRLVLDGLAQLKVPAGVIRGGHSPFVAELCLDRFPSATGDELPVIILEGAGHHLMLDAPERLAEAIGALLSPIDRLTEGNAAANIGPLSGLA